MTVQYSIQKMVSDGTLSTIALGIQYLQRNDIYIRIAGEETPQSGAPSGYTWSFLDNTTLKILPVIPNGVEVVVYRRTDVDAMYNIYSQNAQFDEATIDENNQQLLYIAQEYLEQGLPGAGVDTIEYVRDDGSFTYYRIRRTDGSYSEEFPVPSASNSTKVLTRESLRRSYAEAGFNLVDGSFEVGGTLVNANDVLLQESTGKAFSGPAGVVVAGANPTSGGFVDVSGMVFRKQIIDSNGSLNAKVTPVGEATQITVSEAVSPIVGQHRSRINYYSSQVVEAWVPSTIVTAGFRFAGSYHKGRSPSYGSGVNGRKLVSLIDDLGVESSVKPHNWYAVFACANDGDSSVTYKLMPFLRVGTVSGAKCDLTFAGMGVNAHSVTPTTYSWENDSLTGVDCLVITEGVDNRFSGRVDQIASNTAGSVTLNSVGTVGAFDFILPAPPNFKHYVYLGAFYRDVSEVMNIADSGVSTMFTGLVLLDPAWPSSGAVASPGVKLSLGGYISPLATGIIVSDEFSISTATASGDCTTIYSHDSARHSIGQHYATKSNASTMTSLLRMELMFSVGQSCYMYTAGSLVASRVSGSLQIRGWIEP